ncbi:MAG: translation initiation factor IF-2, partial [Nitrospinae bacterium]|nr:translation initiation factor IF-2 [Nitrospinota bacterium]
ELMKKGQMTTINQMIDHNTATEISETFGYEVEISKDNIEDLLIQDEDREEDLLSRAPVITIMGHVDHGKTRLLDAIRKANVMEGEAGGITQHIGAYRVTTDKGTAVFLDTPGHEAFTAMRARGAQVTDLVIIVVAANEGVMPQTREAIDHAKAAGVPIMVAMNKMDLADANPDRVKQQLSTLDLIPEDWGGDTVYSEISAKENIGIDDLLDIAILQAELMELKANPSRLASGVVVEAKLDRGRGPVATVLVQRGTLNVSDNFVAGKWNGKVRALLDDQGRKLKFAGPSTPVEILGFAGVPEAGDTFTVLDDEKVTREISARRQQRERMAALMASARVSLESFMESVEEGRVKELSLILKADVQGSIEALKESLGKLGNEEVGVKVLHSAVGGITETDVMLAAASTAVIVGFNVRPTPGAREVAKQEKVDIRLYSVIYDAIDEIKSALEGILEPVQREVVRGHAEIRELFHVPTVGTIAGCYVTDGNINRNSNVRLIRDNVVIYSGTISSLRRFKDDVNEVQSGYECGIGIENYNDIKQGDIIEPYVTEEVSRTL